MKKKKRYIIDWSDDKINAFRQTVLSWYDKNKRDVPWRDHQDNPYYIWVSEIMLQQTQVATVIPYFERFIEQLPTIKDLAEADERTLMQLWQGLGYYSRVRNMQTAAKQMMEEHQGKMPTTYEGLLSLKGIGPYTAGAIASIAYELPEPALDGNLMRIATRLFAIKDDITKASTQNQLRDLYRQLIDPDRPGDFNQALMDIGATVMTATNPYPDPHPLKDFDISYQLGISHELPVKSKQIKQTEHHYWGFAIMNRDGQWLMRQHQQGELLKGLWHFPLIEKTYIAETDEPTLANDVLNDWLSEKNSALTFLKQINTPNIAVKHVFSHRIWHVELMVYQANFEQKPEGAQWVSPDEIYDYPISTLQKKLLRESMEVMT